MKTIGGFLAIRDGIRLDYCFQEAINSMLPICDQVCVADSESSDGTRELLNDWASKEPKLKIVDFPWTDPQNDNRFYPTWVNAAREGLSTDYAIYLDADEIFEPTHYPRIKEAAENGESLMCFRWNYWGDAHHVIPKGVCCGTDVIRCGPKSLFFPSDYPDERAAEIQSMAQPATVWVHHYGFLRERSAFFRKAHAVQRIWSGSYDPRLAEVEVKDNNWMKDPIVADWVDKLVPVTIEHPLLIQPWLKQRGWL